MLYYKDNPEPRRTTPGVTTMTECRATVKAAMIGMVLGDGSLVKPQKPTHGSALRLSNIQEDYVRFKGRIIEELTSCTIYEQDNSQGFGNENSRIWILRSLNHPLFTDLRRRFYHDGRKTIDPHLMSSLDERGLAIWYLDDGSLAEGAMKVRFHTDCFNEAEHLVMISGLWKRFGLRCEMQHNWHHDKKHLRLYLRAADREKFFSIVRPTIEQVQSMLYKLPTERGTERIASGRAGKIEALEEAQQSGHLQALYLEGMSLRDIGRLFHINADAVQRQLVKAGVAIRQGTYGAQRFLKNEEQLTPETLRELYVTQVLSADKIAAMFDVDPGCIIARLRQYEIPVRSRAGWRSVKRWSDLHSDVEKQAEMPCSSKLDC